MAKDILGWSKWSPHIGNAITILGLPTVTAIGASLWQWIAPSKGLGIAVVALAAFMMMCVICVCVLWLRDRSRSLQGDFSAPDYDCSWAIHCQECYVSKDALNPETRYQFRMFLVNNSEYPIRYFVEKAEIEMDNHVPKSKETAFVPGVLPRWGGRTRINFPAFSHDQLPELGVVRGHMTLVVRYGHPSSAYSRLTTKSGRVKVQMSNPSNLSQTVPGGLLPAEFSFDQEEEIPC
jgi:hypothetical protein